jgi:hypothetical protein
MVGQALSPATGDWPFTPSKLARQISLDFFSQMI